MNWTVCDTLDIDCGTFMLRHTKSAIEEGKVKEKDMDTLDCLMETL